ncbi:MAG TPA: S-layer homology domain-containing protein [Chloroflexia bacterium]|nr:S-layer homology domain-containing protein [Chloroflexia bacterium]
MSHKEHQVKIRRMGLLLALLLGVITAALVLRYQQPSSTSTSTAGQNASKAASGVGDESLRGVIMPGDSASRETEALRGREQYFLSRYTYPVGYFDGKWLQEAHEQVAKMQSGIPAGEVVYDRSKSQAPLALSPNGMTSLGPEPGQADGCFVCFNYGLVSGRINSVAIDPTMTSTVYLGVSNGGVWKTTNCCHEGTSWSPVTDDPAISTLTIDEVTLDPTNSNIIYVATGDFRAVGAARGAQGILKSTNGGATWSVLGSNIFTPTRGTAVSGSGTYNAVGAVKVDPNNPNALIAGTKNDLWVSYDAGTNWTGPCYTSAFTNTFGTQRQDNTEILMRDNGSTTTVYYAIGFASGTANGANGVYSATMPASGCPSFTLISRGDNGWPADTGNGTASNSKPGRIDLAIAPSNPQIIYAVASNASTLGVLGFWRSTNGGETWVQRSTGDALIDCSPDLESANYGQAFYDQAIDVDPNNPDAIVFGEVDTFRSMDGAQSFQNIGCVYTGGDWIHPDQHDFRYMPGSSNQVLFGNDGGIWFTNNANVVSPTRPTIISMNSSVNTMEFYNGDITGNFATGPEPGANGGTQDNGSFVNVWEGGPGSLGPEEWQLRIGGDGFFAAIEPVNNQTYYQSQNYSVIWRSTQGGYGPYLPVSPGGYDAPWLLDNRSFAMPFEIYKHDCPATGCTHLIAGTYRVWETTNGAQDQDSWYINSPFLTDSQPVCQNPLSLGWACAPFINQLSYAVSMSTTAIAGTSDGNVWYGFNLGQGVQMSAQWVNVSNSNAVLPNRPILDVTTDPMTPTFGDASIGGFDQATPSTPGHVFRVTCSGLLCASRTWENKTGNLPNLPVDSILVNPRFRQQVFVGTDSGLFFTNDIDAATPVWTRFTTGLPNVWVADLTTDRGFTTLAVWTRNRGLYAWPLPNAPFEQPTSTPTVTGTPPTATSTSVVPTVTPGACFNYSVITRTGASLIPATNNTGVFCDDCAAQIQLPFPVTFYDKTFTQGYALTNGNFTFGPANLAYGDDCFPTRNESYSIHAYTTDLCTNNCVDTEDPNPDPCVGCGIFTATTGTAPNRQFIVMWDAKYFSGANGLRATFEIIFTEGSSDVVVIIGDTGDDGASANSGVQRTANTQYIDYSCQEETLTSGLRIEYKLAQCPTGPPTATPTACPIQFQDVPSSTDVSSFYPYVRCLACRGIVSGYPCGGTNPETGLPEPCGNSNNPYYRPANLITRGQISKIVSEASGLSASPGAQIYEDVAPNSPFFQWINRLSAVGVMGGYPCGGPGEQCGVGNRPYFRPGANATRGQMSKIVANAAGFDEPVSSQSFEDLPPSNSPSSYYPFVERLFLRGIVGGYPCGGAGEPCQPEGRPYFRPGSSVTRGQAAKIVANTFFPNCQSPARP